MCVQYVGYSIYSSQIVWIYVLGKWRCNIGTYSLLLYSYAAAYSCKPIIVFYLDKKVYLCLGFVSNAANFSNGNVMRRLIHVKFIYALIQNLLNGRN
jgi:hypothetical protein